MLFVADISHHFWWSIYHSSDGTVLGLFWSYLQWCVLKVFQYFWVEMAFKLFVSLQIVLGVMKCRQTNPTAYLISSICDSGVKVSKQIQFYFDRLDCMAWW